MDKRIIDFFDKHYVMTLATSCENIPYCVNCFYFFWKDMNMMVFISDTKTKHMQDALQNKFVAGSIAVQTSFINNLQGLQFGGIFMPLKNELLEQAKRGYNKKIPFARFSDLPYWSIKLTIVKMVCNKLGFGKKIVWEADKISTND